jgi:hypothetical protein
VSHLEALRVTVAEIVGVLVAHGEKHVSVRLKGDDQRLAASDLTAIQSLLSEATGSMGSLRDRYLSASNGDQISPSNEAAVNARLLALIQRLEHEALAAKAFEEARR